MLSSFHFVFPQGRLAMYDLLKLLPAVVDAVTDNWKLSALIVACMFVLIYLLFRDNTPIVQVGVFLVFVAA